MNDQLGKELNKLKHIRKDIENYYSSTLLTEVLESLRNKDLQYYIYFSNKENQSHIQTYANEANRNKYKAIVQLEEVKYLIEKKKNNKRAGVLLDELIRTNFHMKDTESYLNKWKSKQKAKYKKAYFIV